MISQRTRTWRSCLKDIVVGWRLCLGLFFVLALVQASPGRAAAGIGPATNRSAPATSRGSTASRAAPVSARGTPTPTPVNARGTLHGAVGVGTYTTIAQFKDLSVTAPDGKKLFQADLAKGLGEWYFHGGQWKVLDDTLKQATTDTDCWAIIGDMAWTDYTVHAQARRITGKEGFLLLFRVRDTTGTYCWLNVGGWGNTKAQFESAAGGTRTAIGTSTAVKVEDDRWYDLKVEVSGETAKGYLDGKLVCEADLAQGAAPTAGRGGTPAVSGPPLNGSVGIGTYSTVAQFKDLVVSAPTGQALFQSDLAKGLGTWVTHGGQWKVVDDFLKQSTSDATCWITVGDNTWADYTVKVKARKVTGKEGFLLLFRVRDPATSFGWFNVGGWSNTKSQMEVNIGTTRTAVGNAAPTTIDVDRWYDLQVDVKDLHAKGYLEGKLLCEADLTPAPVTAIAPATTPSRSGTAATGRGTATTGPAATRGGTAAANTSATPAAASQPTVSNATRQNTLRDLLQSQNKTNNAQAFADFKKWYREDPINAEHAFWQLRALFPPLTDRVNDTLDMIQLAWQSKNSSKGDHSDPGYLYALEASCLLQLHKTDEAIVKLQKGLELDALHASEEFVGYISKAVPPKDADAALADVMPSVIVVKPEDPAVVESALRLRIGTLDRLGRYSEALADARRFFNACSMRHTSEALTLVDKYLLLAHPGDTSLDEQFRKEQVAGAVVPDQGAPAASTVLPTIALQSPVIRQALEKVKGTTFRDVLQKASLLLLTGDADQALALARQAAAMAQGNANDTNAVIELVARCYKAQDGTLGRANAYVASGRVTPGRAAPAVPPPEPTDLP